VAPRPVIPRSSNGRTAAFGAVNRGSNPCRGASHFRISKVQAQLDLAYGYLYTEGVSQAIKSLVLYKRHLKNCAILKSRVPRKKRRFWMECQCPIWIHGRTPKGDIVPRQSTQFCDLKRAEALRASLMAQVLTDSITGPPVSECVEKYLATREQDLHPRTLGQHRLALKRLARFLETQNVVHVREMTVDHLETFKTAGLPKKMRTTTKATTFAKIRCFLRAAFRRGWINEALVDRVTTAKAVYDQKEPYTDEEVTAILDHALQLDGGTHGYAKQPKTFRLLLELMLVTGLRVGDAVGFDPLALSKGDTLWIYTYRPQKQKRAEKPKLLEAYITNEMKKRIDECTWLSLKRPFWYGSGTDPTPLAQAAYERMQGIGPRAGIADCRPHRLRDTFAFRALLRGMQLEDVSRLLGHASVKVTETYYAKWIGSRKRRLERLVAESLA
jgi:integrase/recombinase XerD